MDVCGVDAYGADAYGVDACGVTRLGAKCIAKHSHTSIHTITHPVFLPWTCSSRRGFALTIESSTILQTIEAVSLIPEGFNGK